MKKTLLIMALLAMVIKVANAQNIIKETFDSNSLGWTESDYESNNGTAIINKGVMTIKSKGEKKGWGIFTTIMTGVPTKIGEDTFFETHCYAPLDVTQPFQIRTHVKIQKLDSDQLVGLIFNYMDGGNFYVFSFNDEQINFLRYKDNSLVGCIDKGVKWSEKKKLDQEWLLDYDGSNLNFLVDGMEIMSVRYMSMEYAGVGFYTFGKQTLVVDDIEFIQ